MESHMPIRYLLGTILLLAALPNCVFPQTLWDRRDPNSAYLFHDYRARSVGDVLTIVIEENTGSDTQEKREMDKKTKLNFAATGKGSATTLGTLLRSFAGDLDLNGNSQRTFDGKANSTINRN